MYYFAYGSNLDQKQMIERCPTASVLDKAQLLDYQLAFTIYAPHRQCGAADIVKAPTSEVWGLLYSISLEDLIQLDAIEGHPIHYRRIEVDVVTPSTGKITAATYEVVNKSLGHISPSEEYMEKLVRAAHAFNFPDTYKAALQSVYTLETIKS